MEGHARSKVNTQIYEEACAWFVECRAGDLDDSGRREFDRWLRKSPEHLSSYLEIAAIWSEGALLDPDSKWSVETLVEHALDTGDDNVVPLPGQPPPAPVPVSAVSAKSVIARAQGEVTIERPRSPAFSTRSREWVGRWRRLAIAASIAVLTILGGILSVLQLSAPTYATALGEQLSIQFEDGSTVELNSRSKIRVKYSKQERDVKLIEGQALFHVAHDVNRPFIVAVGATRVRAVGTQFDVYKKSNSTIVTVVEGRVAVYSAPQKMLPETSGEQPTLPVPTEARTPYSRSTPSRTRVDSSSSTMSADPDSSISNSGVQVSPPNPVTAGSTASSSLLLGAGEQATVTIGATQKTTHPNIAGATAWRAREIVFESATLSDVAEEFNRYNQRQLVIEDPQLYGFHISGVFSSTDPDSLIKFLRQRPGVKVTETSGDIRIEKNAQ
jgi:transmembrane sensor